MDSILISIKKLLGIDSAYIHFDADIIMHINSVFTILNQLGVGPKEGFMIVDDTTVWNDYLPTSQRLDFVKSYVYMKVRLMFDPPTSSALLESTKQTISELEWRIMVAVDPIEPTE